MQIETFLCKTCFIMHDTRNSINVSTKDDVEKVYQCKSCYNTESKEAKENGWLD